MEILDTILQSKLKFSFILLMILVFIIFSYKFLVIFLKEKKQFISKKVLLKITQSSFLISSRLKKVI